MRIRVHKSKMKLYRAVPHIYKATPHDTEQSQSLRHILHLQQTDSQQAVQRIQETDNDHVNPAKNEAMQVNTDETNSPVMDDENILAGLVRHERQLVNRVRQIKNDGNAPTLPANVTVVGETGCNIDTGKPYWYINKNLIPKCMWHCAELHEKTHARFIRMACERVWNEHARFLFWVKITRQYIRKKDKPNIERALKETEAAAKNVEKITNWYISYHNKTCLYNEITAYEAGNKLCSTAKAINHCRKTGELKQYNRIMASWRQFRLKPPNCPSKP